MNPAPIPNAYGWGHRRQLIAQTRHLCERLLGHRCDRAGHPNADLHGYSVDQRDAAISVDDCFAQIATFAKSQDVLPGQRSLAARAMEGTDLRCRCSRQTSSNGRGAGQSVNFAAAARASALIKALRHRRSFLSLAKRTWLGVWATPFRKRPWKNEVTLASA